MIVQEIRKIREKHAAEFNYDIGAMIEDVRKREAEARRQGQKFVSFPPKPARPVEPQRRTGS